MHMGEGGYLQFLIVDFLSKPMGWLSGYQCSLPELGDLISELTKRKERTGST